MDVLVTIRNQYGGEVGASKLAKALRSWEDLHAVIASFVQAKHPDTAHVVTKRSGYWPEFQAEVEVPTGGQVIRYAIETRFEGDPRYQVPCC